MLVTVHITDLVFILLSFGSFSTVLSYKMLVLSMFQAALALEVFFFFLFYFPSITLYEAVVSKVNPSNSLATTTTTTTTTAAPTDDAGGRISVDCGVYLNTSETGGLIQSVNYPDDYSPNVTCTYTLKAPTPNYTIQLTFTDFVVENCCDFLSVFDGLSTPLQTGINGYSNPGPFKTTSNLMTLIFTTNGNNLLIPSSAPGRWEAKYTFVPTNRG